MVKRIMWFGSIVEPAMAASNKYCSEAANNFQHNLVGAFVKNQGLDKTYMLGPLPIASYPKERNLWIPERVFMLNPNCTIVNTAFINVPVLKQITIALCLRRAVRKTLKLGFSPDAMFAYNPRPFYARAAKIYARKLNIPFILIVADFEAASTIQPYRNPLRYLEARMATSIITDCNGIIALSRKLIEDFGQEIPWIKIEGGLGEEWPDAGDKSLEEPQPKVVVYSGTLTEVGGIKMLLEAFRRIDKPEFRLWITGKGNLEAEVVKAARADSRISYLGFLTYPEYQKVVSQAMVLVNPRLSKYPENRYNFPSKLLEYLASGVPVITTATADVGEDYADKAFILWDETPQSLASLIEFVCSQPTRFRHEFGAQAQEYVLRNKTWDVQAAKAFEFIAGISESIAQGSR